MMALRQAGGEHGSSGGAAPADDASTASERAVVCRACGHVLTAKRERIEIEGKHHHTFVNPSGVEFEIACFRSAPGVAGFGEESSFWSWFPGHTWRIVLCARCGEHVGWSFRRGDSGFFGLIAAAIAQ